LLRTRQLSQLPSSNCPLTTGLAGSCLRGWAVRRRSLLGMPVGERHGALSQPESGRERREVARCRFPLPSPFACFHAGSASRWAVRGGWRVSYLFREARLWRLGAPPIR
jgi:hypothetical protein